LEFWGNGGRCVKEVVFLVAADAVFKRSILNLCRCCLAG
jgi:hypothetical protein